MNSTLLENRRRLACLPAMILTLLIGPAMLARAGEVAKASSDQAASAKNQANPADARLDKSRPKQVAYVTGSRLPEKTSRLGAVPTTSTRLSIITKEQMARTGCATVAGALSRSMNR